MDATTVTHVRNIVPALASTQMLPDDDTVGAVLFFLLSAMGVVCQVVSMLHWLVLLLINVTVPFLFFFRVFFKWHHGAAEWLSGDVWFLWSLVNVL